MGDNAIRADSVALAVKFLAEPHVSAAPIARRVAFLESKGVTAAEIDAALRQTATTDPATQPPPLPSTASPQPLHSITPYKSDWRDHVIRSIGLMGFGFAAFHLLQNYVLPSLSWPNFGQQKETQERMESQLSAVSKALEHATKAIQVQSDKLKDLLDQSLLEQERSAEEVRGIREEIEALKEILPNETVVTKDELKTEETPVVHDVDSFLGKFTTGKPAIPSWQLQATAKPAANETDAKSGKTESSSSGEYSVDLAGGSDAEE
ncbi:peroxisomal membrane protein pex14 [Chytriomyces hyalinus]|nr:peroxisomal membrane protein pex14 [Chytriomyces hyalinus]